MIKNQSRNCANCIFALIFSALIEGEAHSRTANNQELKNAVQNANSQQREIESTASVLVLCKYCIVLNKKVLLFSSIYVNIVLFSIQRVFCIKHPCQYCIVLDTHKGVMTSNEVREECLECHMTSNDVKGRCYITMMTGRCVNKPDLTEPVGCYENTFISKFTQV